MSVTPDPLTRVVGGTSGQWGSNNEMRYYSTVGNKIYYAAWRTDGNGFWWSEVSGGVPRTSIYLDTDDGKWYDHDGLNSDGSEHDPITVTPASSQTVGSGNIALYNASGAIKFEFVNPTEAQASWLPLSAGSGSGSGSSSTTQKKVFCNFW